MTNRWKRWAAPGMPLTAAALLAACSSGSSSSSSSAAASSSTSSASTASSGVAAAQSMVAQFEATTTSYRVPTASISGVSELKGKTVFSIPLDPIPLDPIPLDSIPLDAHSPGFVVTRRR